MVKHTNAGGRTKRANERSIVYVHQHGGDDVACEPPIGDLANFAKISQSLNSTFFPPHNRG